MDDLTIARWRLRTQRLAGPAFGSVPEAVEGLLAVQAENYQQASWAVSTRTDGLTRDVFQRLFDNGEILRTHVLRPTWHFVRPADIRWLVDVTAPRILRTMRQIQTTLDLNYGDLDRSQTVMRESLSRGTCLTRTALRERLEDEGLPTGGQRLGLMLASAELSGLICSGAMEGTDHTYTLLDSRAPDSHVLDRPVALAELAARYFTGHGPATERDLSYWASLTLTDVRTGIAGAGDRLESIEHDGRTYWFGEPPPTESHVEPRAQILQVLDEYHNGYQDSRYMLDVAGIVPRTRGANVGMVLVDGQMIGGMKRVLGADVVRFEINLFRKADPGEQEAVEQAAARYGTFLGLEPEVVMAIV